MSHWETSVSRATTATRAQIWARWTTASAWAEDDPGTRWATLDEVATLPTTPGLTDTLREAFARVATGAGARDGEATA